MVRTKSVGEIPSTRKGRARGIKHVLVLLAFGTEFCAPSVRAQQPDQAWQSEVRKYSDCRDWDDALRIVDQQITRSPVDLDIRAWRAQVLTWAGRLPEAEREFKEILKIETRNPDDGMGLATVYLHRGLTEEAPK